MPKQKCGTLVVRCRFKKKNINPKTRREGRIPHACRGRPTATAIPDSVARVWHSGPLTRSRSETPNSHSAAGHRVISDWMGVGKHSLTGYTAEAILQNASSGPQDFGCIQRQKMFCLSSYPFCAIVLFVQQSEFKRLNINFVLFLIAHTDP